MNAQLVRHVIQRLKPLGIQTVIACVSRHVVAEFKMLKPGRKCKPTRSAQLQARHAPAKLRAFTLNLTSRGHWLWQNITVTLDYRFVGTLLRLYDARVRACALVRVRVRTCVRHFLLLFSPFFFVQSTLRLYFLFYLYYLSLGHLSESEACKRNAAWLLSLSLADTENPCRKEQDDCFWEFWPKNIKTMLGLEKNQKGWNDVWSL
jgi:hypothetical protein